VQLPGAVAHEGVEGLARALTGSLPRRARKTLAALAATLHDQGRGAQACCRAMRLRALTAAMFACDDPGPALAVIGAEGPTAESLAEERVLLERWLAPESHALRFALGYAQ